MIYKIYKNLLNKEKIVYQYNLKIIKIKKYLIKLLVYLCINLIRLVNNNKIIH